MIIEHYAFLHRQQSVYLERFLSTCRQTLKSSHEYDGLKGNNNYTKFVHKRPPPKHDRES